MIEAQFRSQLLTESIRIGDDILERALSDEHGIFWKTLSINDKKEAYWVVAENFYSGNSGIILFFIELFKATGYDRYLKIIQSSSEWLLHHCQENQPNSYAFCTGRMGVSYTLIQLAEFTKDSTYVGEALELARNCDKSLERSDVPCEYINGFAGTLVGLLHLHSYTGEKWLEEKIKKIADHLIQHCCIASKGVHWDPSNKNIRGLCGFSHGAGGVAYALMELYNYTGSQFIFWLATQAFQYEDAKFDSTRLNWPDYRKLHDAVEEEAKMAYRNRNGNYFSAPGNMSAWCHGGPGIGLARLRAKEITGKSSFDFGLDRAIKNTIANSLERSLPTFTLCHGNCGNAVLLLEAYRHFEYPEYFNQAIQVAKNSLDHFSQKKKYLSGFSMSDEEDISLFMGTAGIGYYYLSLLNPLSVTSPLLPRITRRRSAELSAAWDNHNEIFSKFAHKLFPQTVESLPSIYPSYGKPELDDSTALRDHLTEQVRKNVQAINEKKSQRLFQLELQKLKISDSNNNASYLYIKDKVDLEENTKLLALPMDELFQVIIHTNAFTIFNPSEEEDPILLKAYWGGVKEIGLTQLSFEILSLFNDGNNISSVIQAGANLIEADDPSAIQMFITQQVREFLKSRILISKREDYSKA